jgi:hypothetical protein
MSPDTRRAAYRLLATGLVFLAIAAALHGTQRLTFGPQPALVHVRWAPSVDETMRARLESKYSLSDAAPAGGQTWSYSLTDTSRANIRALIGDSAIEDTHYLHRTAFRTGYLSPRRPYRTPH